MAVRLGVLAALAVSPAHALHLSHAVATQLPHALPSHASRPLLVRMMSTGGDDESTYQETSSSTKGLVSGLTGVVNSVFAAFGGNADEAVRPPKEGVVTPAELLEGVRADYEERMYLWTGDIDPNLYDEDCTFTDPTLSFEGLATFQKNLAALQPVLSTLVKRPLVELYSCEMDQAGCEVKAAWRMKGDLALPWRPQIDLRGSTRFTYDPAKAGGRITRYTESWELEAGAALMQIIRPWQWSEDENQGGSGGGGSVAAQGGGGAARDDSDDDEPPNAVARDLVFLLNSPLGFGLFFGLTYVLSGRPIGGGEAFAPISLDGVL